MLREFLLYVLGLVVLLGVAYTVARLASIAHYRTRAEYDRMNKRLNLNNGERDAKK